MIGLSDRERIVNLLSFEHQKELFQLLLREVEVHPFDPEQHAPAEGRGTFGTKVRSKWYRVKVTLRQLPGLSLGERFRGETSDKDKRKSGSAVRGKSELR